MEIHLYTLCWNDADMLPFFFLHYDQIVSRYFIFDEHSTDGSLDILRGHPKVELEPFIRFDPESFALSEMILSNECWKRSRRSADWVIVTDIDEHLFHPNLCMLLARYKSLGITIAPALGYQMISDDFLYPGQRACETHSYGSPWDIYSKLTLFDPVAIVETDFDLGRHSAKPNGCVILPDHDELLLLHYKFLDFERSYARYKRQLTGLGNKDFANGWGYQYSWSREEFRRVWSVFAANAIDVRTPAAVYSYPYPRWWDPLRNTKC